MAKRPSDKLTPSHRPQLVGDYVNGSASARPSGNYDSHSNSQDHVRTHRRTHTLTHSPTTPSTTIGLLSLTLLIRLCLGSTTVSQLLTQERFTPLSLTNYHAWLSLSHFSTQSHNSNSFTRSRCARSCAPDRSVTCSSRAGPAIGRSTKARRQRR